MNPPSTGSSRHPTNGDGVHALPAAVEIIGRRIGSGFLSRCKG